jgi:hypothetical protein
MSSSEYRFLRFEIVGISTLVFLAVGLLPIIKYETLRSTIVDAGTAITILGGLFLASLPLGYWEHQLVVNVYRSPRKERKAFRVVENAIKEIEQQKLKAGGTAFFDAMEDRVKSAFVTSLLDICIYCKDSNIDKDIFGRISDRWSHFYARRSVGSYSPIISFILFLIVIVSGQVFSWTFLVYDLPKISLSAAWWVFIFAFSKFAIDSYGRKLWEEINHLETAIVLANLDKVKAVFESIVTSYMKDSSLSKQDESYGTAIWKM